MTYNFDPEKWYDNEFYLLQLKRRQGKLDQEEYEQALTDLDRRMDEMWQRLDGAYQVNQER